MLRKFGVGVAAVAVLCGLSPVAAGNPTATSVDLLSRANPHISSEVISALPPLVRASSVIIDPSITADTPIVFADGSPVPGQSAAKNARAARAGCGGPYAFIYLVTPKPSTSTCAVFGTPGLKMTYTWNSGPGPGGVPIVGCIGAEGHDDVGRTKWLSAGCGTSGRTTVAWGNNLAKPRVLARSATQGFRGGWSHGSKSSSSKCVVEIFKMPPSVTKNAGRIKCPNVFTSMRAKVTAGSTTRYGKRVGPNAWSTVVFGPGAKVKSVLPVK